MVLTRFSWPHGGRQVFLYGSFSRWTDEYPMTLVEGSSTMFQTFCNLPPGLHQYRFLVDGIWRVDEQQPCITDDYGMVSNAIFIGEPDVSTSRLHRLDGHRTMDVDDGTTLYAEQVAWISDADIEALRRWVSRLLLNQTIYDILPLSNKISVVDVQLPVKRAFHIMYDEGLFVVPIWDDSRANMTGMLTASDFILILRELQSNVRILADKELEMHSVSTWKEGKLQLYRKSNGPVGKHARPLIHVSDLECLKDVALKIVRHEISTVPIFKSSLQEGSCMPLLNLASLPGILKYICSCLADPIRSVPLLQHPIYKFPLGTWLQRTGRGSGRQLAILRRDAPLRSALDLLLKAKISSIPIVDDNGSLLDLYSRRNLSPDFIKKWKTLIVKMVGIRNMGRIWELHGKHKQNIWGTGCHFVLHIDIIALAKGDTYARIQLNQMSMEQALDQVNQVTPRNDGRRRCSTCSRSTTLREIMEQLSDPGVRRLVVIDPGNRQVEGIISLRDVFTFLLG